MATTLQQDIRASLIEYDQNICFSYGRPLDNAFSSYNQEINSYLVCLDPPIYTGSLTNNSEIRQISLSWLKLDNADSHADMELNQASFDSMEEIIQECHDKSIEWLNIFIDSFKSKYQIDQYSGFEAFKVKHMMTGFVITFNVNSKLPC